MHRIVAVFPPKTSFAKTIETLGNLNIPPALIRRCTIPGSATTADDDDGESPPPILLDFTHPTRAPPDLIKTGVITPRDLASARKLPPADTTPEDAELEEWMRTRHVLGIGRSEKMRNLAGLVLVLSSAMPHFVLFPFMVWFYLVPASIGVVVCGVPYLLFSLVGKVLRLSE